MRVWRRYLLFQIPGWILVAILLAVLHHWFGLPRWIALSIFAVYFGKDFALYPFLKRAYEQDTRSQMERMVGLPGVVAETLAPEGFIRVRGELWRAVVRPKDLVLESGRRVRVAASEGLTLIVGPEDDVIENAGG